MLEASEKALHLANGHTRETFLENELLQLGLARLVEIIGEAARQLSDNFIETHAQIPWQEIMGMRNRIAHVYFDVDLKLLWDVIVLDLPVLLDELRRILNDDLS